MRHEIFSSQRRECPEQEARAHLELDAVAVVGLRRRTGYPLRVRRVLLGELRGVLGLAFFRIGGHRGTCRPRRLIHDVVIRHRLGVLQALLDLRVLLCKLRSLFLPNAHAHSVET